ncbi:MAG: GNAT family N-acetyltransferase [Armatimonadota bacterium]
MGRRRPRAEIRPFDDLLAGEVEALLARTDPQFDRPGWDHDRATRPDLCQLATVDGILVGAITGRCLGNDQPDRRGWCRIDAVGVAPAWRRQGIGTQLVRAFLNRAFATTAPGVTATCPEDAIAEAFWIGHGFAPTALELTFDRNHRPERSVLEALGVERTRIFADRAIATIPVHTSGPDRRASLRAACDPRSIHRVLDRAATISERRAAASGKPRVGGGSGPLRRCGICGRWHAWGLGGPEPADKRLCRSCLDAWQAQQQQQQ